MAGLAPRALDAESGGELSVGWLPKARWVPAVAVTGWLLWAYFHLRPAAAVTSSAHPGATYGAWSWGHLAYSDVISLYYAFHLGNRALPYVHTRVEYPVLTGIFMWLAAWAPGVQGYFLASGLGLWPARSAPCTSCIGSTGASPGPSPSARCCSSTGC